MYKQAEEYYIEHNTFITKTAPFFLQDTQKLVIQYG